MVWFRVDDGFWSHPKVLPLPNSSVGLWLRAGCWSAAHLQDGHVPVHALRMLGSTTDRGRLVDAGLWIEREDGSVQFHDWEHYQPTRSEVEQRRMKDRRRQQDWRMSQGVSQRDIQRDIQRDSQRESQRESRNPRPVPARRAPLPPTTPTPPPLRDVLADLDRRIEKDND